MENIKIPYKDTEYFSKIILDYLEQKERIQPFYHRFPSLKNFEAQIKEKSQSFSLAQREVLVSAITNQYQKTKKSTVTQQHINDLALAHTFTITTGHQLNLFSGPLYFLYKIISVINLCKQLKSTHPHCNFVPIYWMASEDHDFEEIQYFNFKANKINWERQASGAVGRLSTAGLDAVFDEFSKVLNTGTNANELRSLFKKAYLEHHNLADASRCLVNALFGDYGLVVVDGDDKQLKSLFKPYTLQELKEQTSFTEVTKTNEQLTSKGYPNQVFPREVNLFYIGDGFRERIIKTEDGYTVNNTDLTFSSAEELIESTQNTNNVVSGNALLRPLYQEVVLPNLCYVGGGGELAYWMQLKSTFNAFKVPFPMLLMRNSALLVSEKQQQKIEKLNISYSDLFLVQEELIAKKVKTDSTIHFNFNEARETLMQNFTELTLLAKQTDASFIGAVKAQEKKQLNGLNNLEKRLLRAEKRNMYNVVTRLTLLQNQLFPNQSLQERQQNFSVFYEVYGSELIPKLLKVLNPLDYEFTVVVL